MSKLKNIFNNNNKSGKWEGTIKLSFEMEESVYLLLSTYCVPGLVLHLGANGEPPTHPVWPLMPVFLPCFCLVT